MNIHAPGRRCGSWPKATKRASAVQSVASSPRAPDRPNTAAPAKRPGDPQQPRTSLAMLICTLDQKPPPTSPAADPSNIMNLHLASPPRRTVFFEARRPASPGMMPDAGPKVRHIPARTVPGVGKRARAPCNAERKREARHADASPTQNARLRQGGTRNCSSAPTPQRR